MQAKEPLVNMQTPENQPDQPLFSHDGPSDAAAESDRPTPWAPALSDPVSVVIDQGGIALLSVRGNGNLNIIDTSLMRQISTKVNWLASLAEVKVLLFRGHGERALIGGADIHEMQKLSPQTASIFISHLRDLCDAFYHFPAPVIARLSGYCLGGGLEVAMACDLRIASRDAKVGMPEVKVGIPSVIHASLLPRLVGLSRSSWMLLSGELIDADTALNWGLVHEVYPPEQLEAMIWSRARSLASMGPAVLRQQKRMMRSWQEQPLRTAIEESIGEFATAYASGEPQHYMNQFINRKRNK